MDSLEKDGKYRLIAYVLQKDTDGSYTVNNVISCSLIEKLTINTNSRIWIKNLRRKGIIQQQYVEYIRLLDS